MLRLFSRSPKVYKIQAGWDEDAGVYYVVESDIPGLHAEAETQDELLRVLKELIPELIIANVHSAHGRRRNMLEVPIELIARRSELLSLGC